MNWEKVDRDVIHASAEDYDADDYDSREFKMPGHATDPVDHPAHYTNGKVECIDALEAATTGLEGIEAVCTANAIKYLWRWKYKNGVEDLEKAAWYIVRLINHVNEEKKK